MSVLTYLQNKEWSMGNGQCPECYGVSEEWLGHPLYLTSEKLGHQKGCPLAAQLKASGGNPLMQGGCLLKQEFELYLSDNGLLGTRKKTKEGCPRIKKINDDFDDNLWECITS